MFLFSVNDDHRGKLSKQQKPSVQLFSGHMKLAGVSYDQNLEDATSQDFKTLASKLEDLVSMASRLSHIFLLLYTFLLLLMPYS